MKLMRDWIVGNRIKNIINEKDYFCISFMDGCILTLQNKVICFDNISLYIGTEVIGLKITNTIFKIDFFNKKSIVMSMKEEDYTCPEAFVFYTARGDFIVDS